MITRLSLFFPTQPLFQLLLLAFLLVFSHNASAALDCYGKSSPSAYCATKLNYTNAFVTGVNSYGVISFECRNAAGSAAYSASCTGSCDTGMVLNQTTGQCVADVVQDDCSTSLWGDLSGADNDGSCDCPGATPVLWDGACVAACADGESRNASGVCESNCPGDTQLVNGVCGCLAGYKVGVFNGQYTCQASSATVAPPIGAPTISGGGTITNSTGEATNIVVNADGSITTTTTINNNTVISGSGTVGAGTATISNGTTTMSTTRDSAGNVISQTGSSTNETKAPTWILPGTIEKATPAPPSGISGAFENAPIVVALDSALGAFPSVGQCSTIALNLNLPMGKVININMDKQCTMFSEIAPYLTMFAMVIYGLMSYRIFLRSASGV